MNVITNYWFVLLAGIVISLGAQIYLKAVYAKYSKIRASNGMSAERFASWMLSANDITDVSISRISGNLTDNYSNKDKTISLSDSTYGHADIAAIGVAAHETGHAVQYAKMYVPVFLRSFMVPVVNIGSNLGLYMIMGSILLSAFAGFDIPYLADIGLILYASAFVFTVVTLPVEFNASRRAIANVRNSNFFTNEEAVGMRRVLTAAALTYVASMFVALLNLLRMISIVKRRR